MPSTPTSSTVPCERSRSGADSRPRSCRTPPHRARHRGDRRLRRRVHQHGCPPRRSHDVGSLRWSWPSLPLNGFKGWHALAGRVPGTGPVGASPEPFPTRPVSAVSGPTDESFRGQPDGVSRFKSQTDPETEPTVDTHTAVDGRYLRPAHPHIITLPARGAGWTDWQPSFGTRRVELIPASHLCARPPVLMRGVNTTLFGAVWPMTIWDRSPGQGC